MEDNRRGWHFDKTISFAHIFTTISAIALAAVVLSQFSTRLTLVEQAVVVQQQTSQRQDSDAAEFKREMREMYRAINDKLDRVIERRIGSAGR